MHVRRTLRPHTNTNARPRLHLQPWRTCTHAANEYCMLHRRGGHTQYDDDVSDEGGASLVLASDACTLLRSCGTAS